MSKLFFGTSGWSYKEWVGKLYRTDGESKLRRYAEVFGAAEIDSTFYSYPTKGLSIGWKMNTPPGFVFTAKIPREITHEKRLDLSKGAGRDLMRFVGLMEPLAAAGKLGCLLIQLPPSFAFDLKTLEGFFCALTKSVRFAVEFRNLSWMRSETWDLLESYNVAYVNVDEPLLPPEVHLTADFSYFRWHGHGSKVWFDYNYSREELERWVPKVKEAADSVKEAYCFFNNHYHGYAVENCLQIMEMLGVASEAQKEERGRIARMASGPEGHRSTEDRSLDGFA